MFSAFSNPRTSLKNTDTQRTHIQPPAQENSEVKFFNVYLTQNKLKRRGRSKAEGWRLCGQAAPGRPAEGGAGARLLRAARKYEPSKGKYIFSMSDIRGRVSVYRPSRWLY